MFSMRHGLVLCWINPAGWISALGLVFQAFVRLFAMLRAHSNRQRQNERANFVNSIAWPVPNPAFKRTRTGGAGQWVFLAVRAPVRAA